MNVYRLLEIPYVYNFVQFLFGSQEFSQIIRDALSPFEKAKVLELGSGTGAFTQTHFENIYASDTNVAYLSEVPLAEDRKLKVDASNLAAIENDFDVFYSVGLYHHLSDSEVCESLKQIGEKLKFGGQILIVDNIMPTSFNPIAYLVRRLDRGAFVRTELELVNLCRRILPTVQVTAKGRYSWCNLEYLILEYTKNEQR